MSSTFRIDRYIDGGRAGEVDVRTRIGVILGVSNENLFLFDANVFTILFRFIEGLEGVIIDNTLFVNCYVPCFKL